MARRYDVDDSEWTEVMLINGYALFMGYLMMGVRGLGLLVITWTTVVLLGGFVSDLGKKDFWSLTGITLIQTSGVFNFLLTEKFNDMVLLSWGLLGAAAGTFRKDKAQGFSRKRIFLGFSRKRIFLAYAASAIQGVVLFAILCPVSILYIFGIYISAGASLWRLIKHDFGNDGDGGANMKPALQVLYSLAVAQGVLFSYKTIHAFAAKTGLAKLVYNELDKEVPEALVAEYLAETVAGCEKDPSFANGRNLVTYGVDLMMEAKSNEGFIAGIKVLAGAINEDIRGRKVLTKYLLTRLDSSSAIIQSLLETVGPRSPYSREIKGHVVTILEIIAPCIRLEQFPRAIECLCSVVDTSSESNERVELLERYGSKFKDYERVELLERYQKDYVKYDLRIDSPNKGTVREKLYQCLPCKWLLMQHCLLGKRKEVENESKREENIPRDFEWLLMKALNIIHKLVADVDNRWILRTCVSNILLSKIARLPIKLIHMKSDHDLFWQYKKLEFQLLVLEKCWELTNRLLVALTETSSPPLLPAAATPVVEGRQKAIQGIEQEVEEGEEQLPDLWSMDGSALRSTIKHTIKHSIESTVKCILDCLDCEATKKRKAIQFLLHLSLDMSTIVKDSESNRRLCWILLLIFCSIDYDEHGNKNCWDFDDGIRKLAGEKLSEMLTENHGELASEETERELQLIRLPLEDLNRAFNDVDISIRTHAVRIMEGLCRNHRHISGVLEGFLVGAIPKVVKETLIRCGPKTAERQEQATDLEMGRDNQDDCKDSERLRKALASLCLTGYIWNYNSTLKSEFTKSASEICAEQGKSFEDFKRLVIKYT